MFYEFINIEDVLKNNPNLVQHITNIASGMIEDSYDNNLLAHCAAMYYINANQSSNSVEKHRDNSKSFSKIMEDKVYFLHSAEKYFKMSIKNGYYQDNYNIGMIYKIRGKLEMALEYLYNIDYLLTAYY